MDFFVKLRKIKKLFGDAIIIEHKVSTLKKKAVHCLMLFNINVIQNKILLSQKNTKILISIITIAVSSTVYISLLSKVKCKCDYNYPFRRNSVKACSNL